MSSLSASKVRPTSLPVGILLEERAPFRVPRYQRPYAWDTDAVDDLIDDIRALLNHNTPHKNHFFGAMVAIQSSDHRDGDASFCEVVDGQQRITTFCLLLGEIVKYTIKMEERTDLFDQHDLDKLQTFRLETEERFLFRQRYDVQAGTRQREARLQLGQADDPMFQALIQGKKLVAERESHRRLESASARLRERLLDVEELQGDASQVLLYLQRVRDAALYDTFVIHIITEDQRAGFRLFSVLNDRGARLTVTDLLRSFTLERLHDIPIIRDQVAQDWDLILVRSGKDADGFLRSFFPSMIGRRARRDELFDDFRLEIFQDGEKLTAEYLAQAVHQLAEECEWYFSMQSGDWPYQSSIASNVSDWQRARLKRLVLLLKHELAFPLLLAARATLGELAFAELVHMLEKFAFRYKNVCDGHASAPSSRYYEAAKNLRKGGGAHAVSSLRSSLRNLVKERAPDSVFKRDLERNLRYDWSSQRGNIKELLTTLDDYWAWLSRGASGSPVYQGSLVLDLNAISIEHIYPLKPTVTDVQMEGIKHRIGNLTILDPRDNKTAANDCFEDKRNLYRRSRCQITQHLAELPSWDRGSYKERHDRILRDACKIFVV